MLQGVDLLRDRVVRAKKEKEKEKEKKNKSTQDDDLPRQARGYLSPKQFPVFASFLGSFAPFFEFSPCLSRACLGKMFVFI